MTHLTALPLAFALLAQACTLPLDTEPPPRADVAFIAKDSALRADVARAADQFRAAGYPHRIAVVADWADVPPRAYPVEVSSVARGTETRSGVLCTDLLGFERSGDSYVWLCDEMSPRRRAEVVVHEMCHVFGMPKEHWNDGRGYGCDDGDTVQPIEIARFKEIWNP